MENTLIQFSGGRTSAFMLKQLLQQHGGVLPSTWKICFENTGKEREETLAFIREIEVRWDVSIIWLEFDDEFLLADYIKPDGSLSMRKLRKDKYRIVNYETASRKGEPFMKMIHMIATYRALMKNEPPVLPNVVQRICTNRLKIKCVHSYLKDCLWNEWDLYMGIRYDEAHRRAKTLQWLPNSQTLQTPLITSKTVKADVNEFWKKQSFDLQLDANSDEGNCDLCFLKGISKLIKIMRKDRTREVFWQDLERLTGQTFSKSKLSFVQIGEMLNSNDSRLQKYEKDSVNDKTIDCFCGE